MIWWMMVSMELKKLHNKPIRSNIQAKTTCLVSSPVESLILFLSEFKLSLFIPNVHRSHSHIRFNVKRVEKGLTCTRFICRLFLNSKKGRYILPSGHHFGLFARLALP